METESMAVVVYRLFPLPLVFLLTGVLDIDRLPVAAAPPASRTPFFKFSVTVSFTTGTVFGAAVLNVMFRVFASVVIVKYPNSIIGSISSV